MSSSNSASVCLNLNLRLARLTFGLMLLFVSSRGFGCGGAIFQFYPQPPGASISVDNTTIAVGQTTAIHADFWAGAYDMLVNTNIEQPLGTPVPGSDGSPQTHRDYAFTPSAPGYYTFYARITTYTFSCDTYGMVTVNVIAAPQPAATPTFSVAGGSYTLSPSVTITSATDGATIVYTTDGSTPSETNGATYSGPISMPYAATTTLQAMAYENGYTDSAVASAAYTIGLPPPPTAAIPLYEFVHPHMTTSSNPFSGSFDWTPDIFLTTNYAEGGNAGYIFDLIKCFVDANPDPGTIPLYRYFFPGHGHFYTTNFSEISQGQYGAVLEGIACYVWPDSLQPGVVPLYRFRNLNDGLQHYYSTDSNGNFGSQYVPEGIQCYVLPAVPPSQLAPLSTSSFAALNALTPSPSTPAWAKAIITDNTSTLPTQPTTAPTPPFYQADAKYMASWINGLMPTPNPDGSVSIQYNNLDGDVYSFNIQTYGYVTGTVTTYNPATGKFSTTPVEDSNGTPITFQATPILNMDGSTSYSFSTPPNEDPRSGTPDLKYGMTFNVTTASQYGGGGDARTSVTAYNEDGSKLTYNSDGTGSITTSDGSVTNCSITQPDGNGVITFTTAVANPGWGNGIVIYVFHQDGTSSATTRDDLGNVIAANYDASGTLVSATFTPYNGTAVAINPIIDANGEQDYAFSNSQQIEFSNQSGQNGFAFEFYLDHTDASGISNVQVNDGTMTFTQANSDGTSTNWALDPIGYNASNQLVLNVQSNTNGITTNMDTPVSTFSNNSSGDPWDGPVSTFGNDSSSDPWPVSWGNNPFSDDGGGNGSAE